MKEIMNDIIAGYKKLIIVIGVCVVFSAAIEGVISLIQLCIGKCEFNWWYIPCWLIDLSIFAGCLGVNSRQ